MGWLGLAVPEEHGGSGYGLPELVVVVEELGRAVAPGPFVPTVTASATIAAYGSAEQQAKLLPGLIDGSRIAAVGFGGDLTVAGGKVSGDAGVVLGAGLADVLLLAAGDDVLVIDRAADGVKVEVPANLDPTRRSGRVVLTDVAAQDVLAGARMGRWPVPVRCSPPRPRVVPPTASTPRSSTPRCANSSAARSRLSKR